MIDIDAHFVEKPLVGKVFRHHPIVDFLLTCGVPVPDDLDLVRATKAASLLMSRLQTRLELARADWEQQTEEEDQVAEEIAILLAEKRGHVL